MYEIKCAGKQLPTLVNVYVTVRNGNNIEESNRVKVDVPFFADKKSCIFHTKKNGL